MHQNAGTGYINKDLTVLQVRMYYKCYGVRVVIAPILYTYNLMVAAASAPVNCGQAVHFTYTTFNAGPSTLQLQILDNMYRIKELYR